MMNTNNYVYLLIEREFIKTGENVYKIGLTKKKELMRFNKYPKGSDLLFHSICINCKNTERKIIEKFKKLFIQRKDYGNEYFEGDYKHMIYLIHIMIANEYKNELFINIKKNENISVNNNEVNNSVNNNEVNNNDYDNNVTKILYYCNICDYNSNRKYNYDIHLQSVKHKKKQKKSIYIYHCDICDYHTNNKYNYDKHVYSVKHNCNSGIKPTEKEMDETCKINEKSLSLELEIFETFIKLA